MEIQRDKKKKDGSTVYRANIYLGVDVITGKKVTTKVTARTKKRTQDQSPTKRNLILRLMDQHALKASTITTYKELALLWWDSYKDTVNLTPKIMFIRF